MSQPLTPEQVREGERRIAAMFAQKGIVHRPSFDEVLNANIEEAAKRDALKIMQLPKSQQMAVAYTPLIIAHIAWHFAYKSLELARLHKVTALKSVKRKADQLQADYNHMLRQDLTQAHIDGYTAETSRFINLCACDFTIFYYTANNEVKRVAPDFPHHDVATYALMAILIIDALKQHNRDTSAMLLECLGMHDDAVTNPYILALQCLMEACTAGCPVNRNTPMLANCISIFRKNIDKIEFVPVKTT